MTLYLARPADGAAWVTGASSGIGRAVALELAGRGYTVVATARDAQKLAALSNESGPLPGRIVPMPGDVTDEAAMRAVVGAIRADFGTLALAVLNAGVFIPVRGGALSVSRFEKTFAVNLMGVVKSLVPAVEAMKETGRGHVALVSSVAGYSGLPTSASYGASKAALFNLAESLKFDLDKLDIRIQVVAPGFVDTPATEKNPFAMPALLTAEEAARRIVEGLGRDRFEIVFPRRFTTMVKLLRILPYGLYFPLIGAATGWSRRRDKD